MRRVHEKLVVIAFAALGACDAFLAPARSCD